MVNVLVRMQGLSLLQVTKVKVKTQNSELGARAGLLFVFNRDEPPEDGFLERFTQYDSWTGDEYEKLHRERLF